MNNACNSLICKYSGSMFCEDSMLNSNFLYYVVIEDKTCTSCLYLFLIDPQRTVNKNLSLLQAFYQIRLFSAMYFFIRNTESKKD